MFVIQKTSPSCKTLIHWKRSEVVWGGRIMKANEFKWCHIRYTSNKQLQLNLREVMGCGIFLWFLRLSHLGDMSCQVLVCCHAGNKAPFIPPQDDQMIPIRAACVVYWGWGRASQTWRILILQVESRSLDGSVTSLSDKHWEPLSTVTDQSIWPVWLLKPFSFSHKKTFIYSTLRAQHDYSVKQE